MSSDGHATKSKTAPHPRPAAPPRRVAGESVVLCAGVMLAGASVMVLELLGTRVLAPVFGNSLYVWTALISVTLFSLTIGYPLGGMIADRYPAARVFFVAMGASGLAVLLTLVIRAPVLGMTSSWGPKAGTLGAGFLLFTLPLILLGMVGPFASRLFVRDVQRVGLTVGTISALSAGGSIVGSILTGFYLIPHIGIRNILLTVGIGLIVISIAGLLITRAKGVSAGVAAAGVVIGVLLAYTDRAPALAIPGLDVLYEGSSAYGDVKMIRVVLADKKRQPVPTKILYLGQVMQTIDSPNSEIPSVSDSVHMIPAVRPDAKRVLLIGLGGGTKVILLNHHGIGVDGVEIDPLVIRMAVEHYGLKDGPLCRIIEADGRPFMRQCTEKYDVLFVDAFGGGVAPAHLFSVEAFEEMKRCLKPGGLLMMNTLRPMVPPEDTVIPSVFKTLGAGGLFKNRRLYAWNPHADDTITNHLIFASDGPLDVVKPLEQLMPAELASRVAGMLVARTVDESAGDVITDDLNPLDVLQLRQNELLREQTLVGDFAALFDPRRN